MNFFFDKTEKRLTAPGLFFALLVAALLLNAAELTNPPYWDEIIGLHNQAVFLARHRFDASRLFVPIQCHISGSWVYTADILPWIYGALYTFFAPRTIHITGHLLNILLLCGTLTMLAVLLRRICSEPLTILWLLTAFCDPIIAGRFAAQGQEAALAFAVMLSFFCFLSGRRKAAFAAVALGCCIKFTGVIPALAYCVYSVYELLLLPRGKRTPAWWTLGANFLLASLAFFLYYGLQKTPGYTPHYRPVFPELRRQLVLFYPYLAVFSLAVLAAFALRFVRKKRYLTPEPLLLPVIFLGGYWVAYFCAPAERLPRYTAIVIAPMVLLAAHSIRFSNPRILYGILGLTIVLNTLNQNGLLLPAYHPEKGYASDLERSREYLKGLHSDRAVIGELEKLHGSRQLVCRWPYAQMLTMPEMGYVSKPLPNVFVADIAPLYAAARQLRNWSEVTPETLWLYSPRVLPLDAAYREFCLPRTTSTLEYVEIPDAPENGIVLFSNFPPRTRRK